MCTGDSSSTPAPPAPPVADSCASYTPAQVVSYLFLSCAVVDFVLVLAPWICAVVMDCPDICWPSLHGVEAFRNPDIYGGKLSLKFAHIVSVIEEFKYHIDVLLYATYLI